MAYLPKSGSAEGQFSTDRRDAEGVATARDAARGLARGGHYGAQEDRDARLMLGASLQALGSLEGAHVVFAELVAAEPGNWLLQFQLARVLFDLGRTAAAVEPLQRAVTLNPDLVDAWRMLGDIWMFTCRFEAAADADARLVRALLRDPNLRRPIEALVAGRLGSAESQLQALLKRAPEAVEPAFVLSEVLVRQGRLADAEALLAGCAARAPGFDLARQSYAAVLFRRGKCDEAMAELDTLLAHDPRSRRLRMIKGAALSALGDYEGAANVMAALVEDFPDQPRGGIFLGNSLRVLGRTEACIASYRRSLTLDPGCAEAYWCLANLKTYRFTVEERAEMERLLAAPGLRDEDRASLHFGLGKAYEDEGRSADAFRSYVSANAIERSRNPYSAAGLTAFIRRCKALFTAEFFAARTDWGADAPDPIFIVGMPRAGSTLVAQILASHPAIEATRELPDIDLIANAIGRMPPGGQDYLEALAACRQETCEQFGRDYVAWTRSHRRQGRERFIDKAPWNFLHIGLIQLVLPRARIIDVRRHPLACGFSIFKQRFESGSAFAYDLEDIGRYYADYVDMMEHYDAVLPGRVHRVVYERLVSDMESEVDRLLAHLGLPFDPACLRFFETRGPVVTASSDQVRRPLSASGVDHWRRFEPFLDPLKAALGSALDAYPAPAEDA